MANNISIRETSSFYDPKQPLDTTVLFRWRSDRERAFKAYASKRGLSSSALLRSLLDGYLSRLGLV